MGDEHGENAIALGMPPDDPRPDPFDPDGLPRGAADPAGGGAVGDVDAELERQLHHERRVAAELDQQRIRDEARRRLAVEKRGPIIPPEILTLRQRIARPRPPKRSRIDGWQPEGSRILLAAQFKAGKTTLSGNLARSLIDGDPWLGKHDVTPIDGTLGILDFEMNADQLDDWLRDQRIRGDDRVIPIPMRGRAATFDILDDDVRAQWAKTLREHGVTYLILDCIRPILDALGLSEDKEAGRFLVQFDALLSDAGIPDALAVHHMGHSGERSRGDSRLRDWPDVEWRLVREDDEPHSPRYVSAYGRDVDIPESQLAYNPDNRHLTLAGGSRKDAKAAAALAEVLAALDQADQPLTTRAIEQALSGSEHTREAVRRAVKLGIRTGAIVTTEGARRAVLHSRPDTSAPVRGSVPQNASTLDVSAPVRSIDGAHTHAHSEPPSVPNRAHPTPPANVPEQCIHCGEHTFQTNQDGKPAHPRCATPAPEATRP